MISCSKTQSSEQHLSLLGKHAQCCDTGRHDLDRIPSMVKHHNILLNFLKCCSHHWAVQSVFGSWTEMIKHSRIVPNAQKCKSKNVYSFTNTSTITITPPLSSLSLSSFREPSFLPLQHFNPIGSIRRAVHRQRVREREGERGREREGGRVPVLVLVLGQGQAKGKRRAATSGTFSW